ncbi:MAG TPA: flagellar hook capping FlgD N-terminal domain-containing protein [Xanthobacteraceae bacterium]|jgi:flagellar basal-body rod modification protein FlgD|nr:flagellar hook capping FlgD N-terminal domain-containing protein [Xanthobacteraceae bacterium]
MTTTTATPTTTTSNASTAQAASAVGSQEFAGNFNTFLTLLTTQLQNQDPLSPMDTSQFTSQLVEFASVEQQINMNTNLQSLMSMQQTSDSLQALQLVGANVTIDSSTATLSQATKSPATWSFSSPSPATGTVTITSSTGQVAFTGTTSLSAGNQNYTWNGQGNNGVTWPDGNYTMSITATGANGQPVTVTTQVQGTISSVNISQNPPTITVNGQSYPISAIQSINSGGGSSSNGLARLLH